jgi:hypothetical protein
VEYGWIFKIQGYRDSGVKGFRNQECGFFVGVPPAIVGGTPTKNLQPNLQRQVKIILKPFLMSYPIPIQNNTN